MGPGLFTWALEVKSDGVFLVKLGMDYGEAWRRIGLVGWRVQSRISELRSMTMKGSEAFSSSSLIGCHDRSPRNQYSFPTSSQFGVESPEPT